MSKDFGDCFTETKLIKIIKDNNINFKDECVKILKRNKINLAKEKDIIYGCYNVSELKNILLDKKVVNDKKDFKGMKKTDLINLMKNNNIKLKNLPTGKKVYEAQPEPKEPKELSEKEKAVLRGREIFEQYRQRRKQESQPINIVNPIPEQTESVLNLQNKQKSRVPGRIIPRTLI